MTCHVSCSFSILDNLRLRREHFGGLVFDSVQKATIDLDRPTFRILELVEQGFTKADVGDVLRKEKLIRSDQVKLQVQKCWDKLLSLGLIVPSPPTADSKIKGNRHCTTSKWPDRPILSAPEKIEWAITFKCQQNCPDCYAKFERLSAMKDLPTESAVELVKSIAQWGVFQLDITGGEPLLRPDLTQIISTACQQGLMVNLTTAANSKLDDELLQVLSHKSASLSIGLKPSDLFDEADERRLQSLAMLAKRCQLAKVEYKANLILTEDVVFYFDNSIKVIVDLGFNHIKLLRYKYPLSRKRWVQQSPSNWSLINLDEQIDKAMNENLNLSISLDCALAFLQRKLPSKVAEDAGLKGCQAGTRVAAINPSGELFPCSQLIHQRFSCGNILQEDPETIWRKAHRLKPFRSLQQRNSFRHSHCGFCQAKHHCGGCRLFAEEIFGGDEGCPDPVFGSLLTLGKYGRRVDLDRLLKEGRREITVGEYMERYGVNQQRAVKELKANPKLEKADPKSKGVRKRDAYVRIYGDTIAELMEDIPYATYEQTSESIGSPANGPDYPQWLEDRISSYQYGDYGKSGACDKEAEKWQQTKRKRKRTKRRRTKKRSKKK